MLNTEFKVKEEKVTDHDGEFVIEPLEQGFGHTLGNALRRTLLTAIPGAAVTSIKITGVKHRFSTIPGLKENVIDFLLNIKGLNFRLLDSKSKSTATLSVKGPKKIVASDLELPDDLEVVNEDHYIGFLADKKSKIEMELTIEKGWGYSLAEERKVSTLGVITTDAIFTPIRRVNYEVSATRVGRETDLDKLTIRIWTNGVVRPREALDETARILSSYFAQVYEPKDMTSYPGNPVKPVAIADSVLKLTIDELDLPTRIYNSLRRGGIETLGRLLEASRKDLISIRNMGNKSVSAIEEKLKEKGLSLAS